MPPLVAAGLLLVSVGASSAAPGGTPATPLEPIPSILKAFEQYSVVAQRATYRGRGDANKAESFVCRAPN